MAPPRQRAPANLDDSRSEASSGTREHKGAGSKSRKPANVSAAAISMATKDMRVAATVATVSGLPGSEEARLSEELPAVSIISYLEVEAIVKIRVCFHDACFHHDNSTPFRLLV